MQKTLQQNLDKVFDQIILGVGVIYTSAKMSEFDLRTKNPSEEINLLIETMKNIQQECDHLYKLMGIEIPHDNLDFNNLNHNS